MRPAIGRAFFTAGRAFLVNQLLECGSEEKDGEGVEFISKFGYTIHLYLNLYQFYEIGHISKVLNLPYEHNAFPNATTAIIPNTSPT